MSSHIVADTKKSVELAKAHGSEPRSIWRVKAEPLGDWTEPYDDKIN